MSHLTEETLNEYLDGELAPAVRRTADGHLSECPDCTARLEALRALFAGLEGLPDTTLGRDLAPAVVAALAKRRDLPRLARLVLVAQVLAVAALLGLAWPLLQLTLLPFQFNLRLPTTEDLAGQWAALTQAGAQLGRLPSFNTPILVDLNPPAMLLALALVSACVLGLVGNGLLLRPRAGSYKRRHS